MKKDDLKVFIIGKEADCVECGDHLDRHAWVTLVDEGVLCLSCADLDHLAFLPSGNTALTRRAGKYSNLKAVVLQWSRNRKRYERQGILVEEAAIIQAEEECAADEDVRAMRREREAERREVMDQEYIQHFAERIRKLYPASPEGIEHKIAEHACLKYSGRVGRSAGAKKFDDEAILLAVIAHIRHTNTQYDALLSSGLERISARKEIQHEVEKTLKDWRGEK
jgi:hypothetical protein